MALRKLTAAIMVSMSSTWTNPKHADRKALAAVPEAAGMLKRLDAAHRNLLNVQLSTAAPPDGAVQSLKSEARAVDARHDDMVRAIYWYLSAAAMVAENNRRAELIALRDMLLPEGLAHIMKSYAAEVGEAVLAGARLTDAHREMLAALPTPDGPLLSIVERWLSAAARLGELEHARAGLDTDTPLTVSKTEVSNARNEWIRTVNALRGALDLVEELSPEVSAILERIAEAERRAERRTDNTVEAEPPANDTVVTRVA